jgi:hypothetical protein
MRILTAGFFGLGYVRTEVGVGVEAMVAAEAKVSRSLKSKIGTALTSDGEIGIGSEAGAILKIPGWLSVLI